jgi:pimeloyl-ACP methyl ester carboxylesterase
VVFVDGIGGRRYMRRALMGRLSANGHACHYFDYRPSREPLDAIQAALADRLRLVAEAGPYVVIGYSFGGVLARSTLTSFPDLPQPNRLFLVASPTHSLRMCRAVNHLAIFRWLTGECGALLASDSAMNEIRFPAVSTTCIYGTTPIARRLSLAGAGTNDGMVSVEEIGPKRFEDAVPVRSSHPFIPGARAVTDAIAARLGPRQAVKR